MSVAGYLWNSNQNMTKRFSCLDGSELATIPCLKMPPRSRKDYNAAWIVLIPTLALATLSLVSTDSGDVHRVVHDLETKQQPPQLTYNIILVSFRTT